MKATPVSLSGPYSLRLVQAKVDDLSWLNLDSYTPAQSLGDDAISCWTGTRWVLWREAGGGGDGPGLGTAYVCGEWWVVHLWLIARHEF